MLSLIAVTPVNANDCKNQSMSEKRSILRMGSSTPFSQTAISNECFLFVSSIQAVELSALGNNSFMVGTRFKFRSKDLSIWWIDSGHFESLCRCRNRYPDRHFPGVLTCPQAVRHCIFKVSMQRLCRRRETHLNAGLQVRRTFCNASPCLR